MQAGKSRVNTGGAEPMNAAAEVREEYKSAVRNHIKHSFGKDSAYKHPQFYKGRTYKHPQFYKGRMSGLETALDLLGVGKDEVREMFEQCKEETMDELAQEERGA